jgi:hypothetical protein
MAGHGPAPTGKRSRARDEKPVTELVATGALYGPELPDPKVALPKGEKWHPQTVAFWDALRRSPLMANEDDLSWSVLLDTAFMHHKMWQHGRWDFAAELRLRLAKYGATPEDKARLRIKVVTPPPAPSLTGSGEGKVTDIRSRRARLTEQSE